MKKKIEALHEVAKKNFRKENFRELNGSFLKNLSELISIDKTVFFPYGYGLWNAKQNTKSSILVLGQDFGNECSWLVANAKGEKEQPTLRGLQNMMFEVAGIKDKSILNECFFTNCFIGLRDIGYPITGPLRNYFKEVGIEKFWDNYIKQSEIFLDEQLKGINPEKILILGLEPALFLSRKNKIEECLQIEKGKTKVLESMMRVKNLRIENRKLFLIPHPSNWNRYKSINEKNGNGEVINLVSEILLECFKK